MYRAVISSASCSRDSSAEVDEVLSGAAITAFVAFGDKFFTAFVQGGLYAFIKLGDDLIFVGIDSRLGLVFNFTHCWQRLLRSVFIRVVVSFIVDECTGCSPKLRYSAVI